MKKLDEVIEILENVVKHDYVWFDENTALMTIETLTDTLQYLQMYRSDMQMYAENQKHWEDELAQKIKDFGDAKERYITRLKELDIGTLNEPLTWDELKAMEGKPIWIELLGKGKWKGWDVIGGFDDDDFGFAMCTVRGDDYYLADLGKTWQAYRKEHHE